MHVVWATLFASDPNLRWKSSYFSHEHAFKCAFKCAPPAPVGNHARGVQAGHDQPHLERTPRPSTPGDEPVHTYHTSCPAAAPLIALMASALANPRLMRPCALGPRRFGLGTRTDDKQATRMMTATCFVLTPCLIYVSIVLHSPCSRAYAISDKVILTMLGATWRGRRLRRR